MLLQHIALWMLTAFSWCPKARQIRRSYYTSIASSVLTEKASKNMFATLKPPARRKKSGTGKPKPQADAIVEEVDFLCGLVVSNAKERTDMKLEIVDMKQEIADMKQEIADMKQEIADMKQEIADMKQEIADMKQEIADMKQEIADMKQEIADMKQEIADMKQEIEANQLLYQYSLHQIRITIYIQPFLHFTG